MTPEQQQIAIAKECGWLDKHNRGLAWSEKENRSLIVPGSQVEAARIRMGLPCKPGDHTFYDYLHDANAMAEARKTLTPQERAIFGQLIAVALGQPAKYHDDLLMPGIYYFDFVDISLEKQAEAFLRAKGKWV